MLIQAVAPAPSADAQLPPLLTGMPRLQLVYRAVLERPERFELLDNFSPARLRDLVRSLSPTAGGTSPSPEELLAIMHGRVPHAMPNQLWAAWMETVHGAKLQQG
jgi:hypothetical protein